MQHQRQSYGRHNSHSATGNPWANQVDFTSTFQELQSTLPTLYEDQYVQILSTLHTKRVTLQANTTASLALPNTSGLLLDCGATHHMDT